MEHKTNCKEIFLWIENNKKETISLIMRLSLYEAMTLIDKESFYVDNIALSFIKIFHYLIFYSL